MLIVIESPNKIKKIKEYLQATVLATVGRFQDLSGDSIGADLGTYTPMFVVNKMVWPFPLMKNC